MEGMDVETEGTGLLLLNFGARDLHFMWLRQTFSWNSLSFHKCY